MQTCTKPRFDPETKIWTIRNKITSAVIFEGADLSYANLSYANLCNANLGNANLGNADLRYADLRYADLSNADLSNANLCYANLRNANLRNANLGNADLRYAFDQFGTFTKPPIVIQNLQYDCVITEQSIRLGCQWHIIEDWKNFSDSEIGNMDGLTALGFWAEWKDIVLCVAAKHRGKNA